MALTWANIILSGIHFSLHTGIKLLRDANGTAMFMRPGGQPLDHKIVIPKKEKPYE